MGERVTVEGRAGWLGQGLRQSQPYVKIQTTPTRVQTATNPQPQVQTPPPATTRGTGGGAGNRRYGPGEGHGTIHLRRRGQGGEAHALPAPGVRSPGVCARPTADRHGRLAGEAAGDGALPNGAVELTLPPNASVRVPIGEVRKFPPFADKSTLDFNKSKPTGAQISELRGGKRSLYYELQATVSPGSLVISDIARHPGGKRQDFTMKDGTPVKPIFHHKGLFNAQRQTQSAPVLLTPGGQSAFNWLRLPSVTHSFDSNQRLNRLAFTPTACGALVRAPSDPNLCPRGHSMLFALNSSGGRSGMLLASSFIGLGGFSCSRRHEMR